MTPPVSPRFRLPYGDVDGLITRLDTILNGWGPRLDGMVKSTRTFAYYGGFTVEADGTVTKIADGTIAIPDGTTKYVQRAPDGTVTADATLDLVNKMPMAVCTAASGALVSAFDIRDLAISQLLTGGPTVSNAGSAVVDRAKILNFIGATITLTGDDQANISISGTGTAGGDPAFVPDTSPTTQTDEFSAGSLDGKWGWRNQNGSAVTFARDRLVMQTTASTNASTNKWSMLTQALGANWCIRTRLVGYNKAVGLGGGLVCYRSTNNKFVTWSTYHRVANAYAEQVLFGSTWTNFTTQSGGGLYSENVVGRQHFLQMRYDGTTIYLDYSPDNVRFINITTAVAATELGGAPDEIGIAGNAPSVATDGFHSHDWFRVYHNANLNQ